jgi:hypothetical protein
MVREDEGSLLGDDDGRSSAERDTCVIPGAVIDPMQGKGEAREHRKSLGFL